MSQSHDPETDSGIDIADLAERNPVAHPAIASLRLFDYSLPPGDHLAEFYNALWKAVDEDFEHAPTKIARLMPRGHGKSEGACVVFPTWLILRHPEVRVAVISKTAALAAERTEKVVEYVDRHAPKFGIDVETSSGTQLTTAANTHKESTVSAYGLESQLTGKHFDVVIFDDIADWDNQRTETQRRNVRNYFRDYVDNLGDPDSIFENGAIMAMIGTRKHPQDIYSTDVLDSPRWESKVYRAIHQADWPIVESRNWTVQGDDGQFYDSLAALPEDVTLANNGIIPNQDVRVLWPEHKSAESLLSDIVGGDQSTAIWQRENQQDPRALSGEVFKAEWLVYEPTLPNTPSAYEWYAGMDLGLVDDLQQAAENDTDFTALAIIAWNDSAGRGYLHKLVRDRGLSVKGAADWAERHLADYDIDNLLVEQNANRGVSQRLRDETDIPSKGTSSTGSKEERIHNMAADFESGTLRIVGNQSDPEWQSFEQDEWLQFPSSNHDDRLDAIELALRSIPTEPTAIPSTW